MMMDNRDNTTTTTTKQESSSLLSSPLHNNHISSNDVDDISTSKRSSFVGGNDRLKRDEWSEGAVSSLLEAYESKWILRNRAKLKGQDWEDVAKFVSSRGNHTKSPKTQTQCKNKIESMKKRYRSESAASEASSSWPLYPRLDLLLRGSGSGSGGGGGICHFPPLPPAAMTTNCSPTMIILEPPPPQQTLQSVSLAPALTLASAPALMIGAAQNSLESNGPDRIAKGDGAGTKTSDQVSDKNNAVEDTDSSTPAAALYSEEEKANKQSNNNNKKARGMKKTKRRRKENWEIAESIRWLAEVVARSEQTRMETMKEVEKMRAEAEAKRGEIDLKRTEIIAKTQLEIAKLFAGGGVGNNGKAVDSSLRIGRS